ncbi:MAG: histone deacetylase [Halanaerobacter sp.]
MRKAENRLGLIFFPAFDWSISPTHPEREERLLYTKDQIEEEGIFDISGIEEYNPSLADKKDINRTHFCIPNTEKVVTKPHLISAGGAIKAADLVLQDKVDSAFAIIRPPGHHAFQITHGTRGFCTINNEAVMVNYIRHKYGTDLKIAIVDTDAHHADGTQDIFYHDSNILHISLHQNGRTLFPGTGFKDELGGATARGYTLNLALPPSTTDQGLHYAVDNLVLPVLKDFNPDLIINSAGQDNHFSDPLTNMQITAQGYAKLNHKLDPDLAIMQGGYAIETALPYTNLAIILAMAGLDYSGVVEPDYNKQIEEQSTQITQEIKKKVDFLINKWQARETLIAEELATGDYTTTTKTVTYDTDRIRDKQRIKTRLCSQCLGLKIIESQAAPVDYGKIKAIEIPFNACPQCQQEGYQEYERAKEGQEFDYCYLQNKAEDETLSCQL